MKKLNKNIIHESARKHVTGRAVYVDDMAGNGRTLFGLVVYSTQAHARIHIENLEQAGALPGVNAVLTAADIPGANNLGPLVHDELCLAENEVHFIGQAIALIAARDETTARAAAGLLKVVYEPLPALVNLEQAIEANSLMGPERRIENGSVDSSLTNATHRLRGIFKTGAQEHWYLETQVALVRPGEDDEMTVFASTQNPTETQTIVAEVLGIARHAVTVETRRMGGGFGGKETQAHHVAAWAALLAHATGQEVKLRLFRDDDQIMTGKRHPFLFKYEVGFDSDGRLQALHIEQNADGGAGTDLSFAILERAMFHAENAYFIPNVRIIGRVYRTNLPSNTAFRGFGGPQGIAAIEHIMDRIARYLNMDGAKVRELNFYGLEERNTTPYGQTVEENHLPQIWEQLQKSSKYFERRAEVTDFNKSSRYIKRGLAMCPVKFGISFTTSFLNQAGALVHFYQDGTVLVNHGGTEMGQGLFTKIQQIAASELGLPLDKIRLNATNTSKVANTSPTAASSGTDLNGMAVKNAIDRLKFRMAYQIAAHFNDKYGVDSTLDSHVLFKDGQVFDATDSSRSMSFREAVQLCYQKQAPLSSTGFYSTPGIHFDREKGRGNPFYYFAYGMAVSEVEVDLLTGDQRILRSDILHDVGDSINPAIDLGQVQGAFIQGVGWCTTEECKHDEQGRLLNHSPDTYKIPTLRDIPKDFRVQLMENVPHTGTIHRSKAVGEPPFMLAISVWLAIRDALAAAGDESADPPLNLPATNEEILRAGKVVRESAYEKALE